MLSTKFRQRGAVVLAMTLIAISSVAMGCGVQEQVLQASGDGPTAEKGMDARTCDDGPWAFADYSISPSLDKPYSEANLIALVEITDREVVADIDEGRREYFGVHTASVVETFKGSANGETITIGTIAECLDEGRYFLFLGRTSTGQVGHYEDDPEKVQNPGQYVPSGPQGQYQVVDGRIVPGTSLKAQGDPGVATDALTRGKTEAEFINLLGELGRNVESAD